ncbi:HNH endonuclease [Kosakonia sacchari]|uniref:HNH endonuclease n=1 Tax=Kosakonia sacchari TaxID=1158459 RepID=UPI003F564EC0
MKCIFCKMESTSSKSVEHIIPESLLNTKNILPAGIVCDKCNNYFSRKVEKPFISTPGMELFRFHQIIPNKKGRVPSVKGAISGSDLPVKIYKFFDKSSIFISVELNDEQLNLLEKGGASELFIPIEFDEPAVKETSRFIAKVALEAIAQRLIKKEGGIDYIISETQFDPIRNHARYGQPKEWPYFSRRIYDVNNKKSIHGSGGQLMHEYDFLCTEEGEIYFVMALYGVEMTINIGGPDIEGYVNWLEKNNNASPLYWGKNESR